MVSVAVLMPRTTSFINAAGTEELTEFTRHRLHYTFRRLGGATSHPFYPSDTALRKHQQMLPPSMAWQSISRDYGDQAFTVSFNENVGDIATGITARIPR